jgi:hypothetical protein
MQPVFHLSDDVEILLQREKPEEAVPKDRVVIRYRDPNFGLGRHP